MKVPHDESFDDDEDLASLMNRTQEESSSRRTSSLASNPIVNCCVTCAAYIQFFWIHHRTESILFLVLLLSVSLAVTGVIEAYEKSSSFNPRKHNIAQDYSGITSDLELKLGKIDHYCFDGGDENCPKCEDPTKPSDRYSKNWAAAFSRNKQLSRAYLQAHEDDIRNIDVIFLGDSNTEARVGTFKGVAGNGSGAMDEVMQKSKSKFEKYFNKAQGAELDGLALGIAGDASPNLLWRIHKNEMQNLQPKVWWISIGINDLLSNYCSEEITLMGILRIVEELLHREDGSTIVINSILPAATRSNMILEGKYAHNKYWPAIKKVNTNLRKFAKKHDRVKFFDANSILIEKRGRNSYMIKKMFADKVHLSAEGQKVLAEAQASTISALYAKKADNKGDYRDSDGAVKDDKQEVKKDADGNAVDEYGYLIDDSVDDLLPNWNNY
mmetsp:Transcript_723/g.999  ORF Transcript_723/g.999 Transcript_723/m.999 type:complete len:440 (+) Transcript_723:121-1440(+)|eukprot:CAMPEP_0197238626 /NCGR_PEP_ID=MMETSP1429-20130617/5142_1 /TAXON_ID=49237 /ORGANISM="Chaetoceros  sp., Strain UNC1202" /LENGTH=439 /DNA_ID=CAMNT_0042697843 /DNA_START=112 /DNA_END=1431 /DNA_ORIENTATION=-